MHLKPRLSRLFSVYYDGAVFFVTFCTQNRRPLLANEPVHRSFSTFCSAAQERHILVGRYVIMADYLHLFVHLPNPDHLSSWVKSLKNSLSKTLREQKIESPHWQRNYFDHLLRSDESACQKWEYVRLNPVRAGLVTEDSEWPYQGEIAMLD
jgi:REP element-mobilizing transposase RayT